MGYWFPPVPSAVEEVRKCWLVEGEDGIGQESPGLIILPHPIIWTD